MSGGPERPPGLEPSARPPPKRLRSAPPSRTRTLLGTITEEGPEGGAPARARPPERDAASRSQTPSFETA
eukprot:11438337-Alexandrium_andersonii.AAC.1